MIQGSGKNGPGLGFLIHMREILYRQLHQLDCLVELLSQIKNIPLMNLDGLRRQIARLRGRLTCMSIIYPYETLAFVFDHAQAVAEEIRLCGRLYNHIFLH